MGCYGFYPHPHYHVDILPCIPDCETTLTYQEMVDYFMGVSTSGITVSGGVSYDEMANYVATHMPASGVTRDEMISYVNEHCSTSGITYEDMVLYVSQNCTYSGVTTEQMEQYVIEYVMNYCTSSGVSYSDMVNYVNASIAAIPTYSGISYQDMVDYVSANCTYSGVTTEQMEFYVTDYVSRNCTFSGVTYDEMTHYVDAAVAAIPSYSGVLYQEMVEYVSTHCTYSGVTYSEMMDYVNSIVSDLSTFSGVMVGGGYILTGSGVFTSGGTPVDHNIGTTDHVTIVTPEGTSYTDLNNVFYLGSIYIELGINSDIVYVSGEVLADDIPFTWLATTSGGSSGGISDVTTAYVDEKMKDLCEHFHLDLLTTSGALYRDILFLASANLEFQPPTFDRAETWDVAWDGGTFSKPTSTVSGSCS